MQLILSAMRRPATVMVLILSVAFGSFLAVGPSLFQHYKLPYPVGLPKGMEVDIFPKLNLPVIYVCQPYGGMDPAQMEGFLTNYYEYHFLYISGIHHVEHQGHYVHPASSANSQPLLIVAGTNQVRVFVDIPELEAPLLDAGYDDQDAGDKAVVRVQSLADQVYEARVTRSSWSLSSSVCESKRKSKLYLA